MDDFSTALLSKGVLKQYYYLLRTYKAELEKKQDWAMLLRKYSSCLWFQRTMFKSYEQLNEMCFEAHQLIDSYKTDIADIELKLHSHYTATEVLHKSMKPYQNINLGQYELSQQNLFSNEAI